MNILKGRDEGKEWRLKQKKSSRTEEQILEASSVKKLKLYPNGKKNRKGNNSLSVKSHNEEWLRRNN